MKKFLSLLVFVAAIMTSLAAKADPITVYVNTPYETTYLWAWHGQTNVFDNWPGRAFTDDDKTSINGVTYYYYTFADGINPVNVIFNGGNDSKKTANIEGITESKAYKVESDNNYEVVSLQMATPVISCTDNVVTITCADEYATIYYTTDDTEPSASSETYSEGLKIAENCTVKAIAVREGFPTSEVASQSCEFAELVVATPEISQNGNFVTITTATEGATIYYSLDGENPTQTNSFEYTAPFEQKSDCTIKAIAVKENFQDSEVASLDFTVSAGITVYVKKDAPFTVNYIYAWVKTSEGDKNITAAWPGGNFQGEVVEDGITFLVYTFDAKYTNINLIFSENGNNQRQTVDVKDVKYSSTFEISSDKDDASKYKVNSIKTTGIESIAQDAEVAPEYFNLQGVKIANPENGLYIKRVGNKAEKVYIR
ncbi:MAG: FN3 associated domain-containing protein [Muribaculaceae bacterium]